MFELKVGDVVKTKEGRDGKIIGYSQLGKVILSTTPVKVGHAVIKKIIKHAEKYYLVEMENVIFDYYEGMHYDDLKKLLTNRGYIIGYEYDFKNEASYIPNGDTDEKQLMAFNTKTGIMIVAETYNFSYKTPWSSFNSIVVYCPNVNCLEIRYSTSIRCGSSSMAEFDLVNSEADFPLYHIEKQYATDNPIWQNGNTPNLWTYADCGKNDSGYDNRYGFNSSALWNETISRILQAPVEIEQLFVGNKQMKAVFATR